MSGVLEATWEHGKTTVERSRELQGDVSWTQIKGHYHKFVSHFIHDDIRIYCDYLWNKYKIGTFFPILLKQLFTLVYDFNIFLGNVLDS